MTIDNQVQWQMNNQQQVQPLWWKSVTMPPQRPFFGNNTLMHSQEHSHFREAERVFYCKYPLNGGGEFIEVTKTEHPTYCFPKSILSFGGE
jgi:hypothetical protein